MSSELLWMIVRNNHSYMVKSRTVKKPFSKEPNNLTNLHSPRFNGFIHKKLIGIEAPPDKKGFVVVHKVAKNQHKPSKAFVRVTMKAGPRRSLYKLKKYMKGNKYRRDLKMPALRRASAVLRSQRRTQAKKGQGRSKKAD